MKQGETCDYSIRLNWEGRGQRKAGKPKGGFAQIPFDANISEGSPSSVGSAGIGTSAQTGFGEFKLKPGYERGELGEVPSYTSAPAYRVEDAINNQSPHRGGTIQTKRPNSEPPFFPDSNDEICDDSVRSPRPNKRIHHDRPPSLRTYYSEMLPPPTSAINSPNIMHSYTSPTPSIPQAFPSGILLTPESVYNGEYHLTYNGTNTVSSLELTDPRRLSINSLLSGGSSSQYPNNQPHTPRSNSDNQESSIQYRDIYTDHTTYGIDRGIRDHDYGKNDDANAISPTSSMTGREQLSMILNDESAASSSNTGSPKIVVEETTYYNKPVSINIPRLLEPLPALLLENSMNLLVSLH